MISVRQKYFDVESICLSDGSNMNMVSIPVLDWGHCEKNNGTFIIAVQAQLPKPPFEIEWSSFTCVEGRGITTEHEIVPRLVIDFEFEPVRVVNIELDNERMVITIELPSEETKTHGEIRVVN